MEDYNAWELHWSSGDALWPVLMLAILFPLTLWFFWFSLSRLLSTRKKILLFSLRITALVLLLLVTLQPRIELKHVLPQRNAVAVLIDDSKSLGVKTFPDGLPRMQLIRDAIEQSGDFFDRLKQTHQVDYYFFSDRLTPVSREKIVSGYRPRGLNTDFPGVFTELQKRYEGKSLQGVVLLSDGADLSQEGDQLSPEMSGLMSGFDGPLYTYTAGDPGGVKDLGIPRVEVSDFGFVHQPLNLTATINATNMGARSVSVVLKEGNKIHASRILNLKPGQERYQVELNFTPGTTGKRFYTLSMPVFAGEAVEVNNQAHFQINVVRDRIRVLHLNGRPSWDSRFLREVLANNPKVDLLSFFILRTLTDDVMASTQELSLIPFPSNLLFTDYLSSFDLVIFHNFRFKPFIDRKYLTNIKSFVEKGGAFLMIGGDLSFQSGEYQRTPVEDILPVRMDRNTQWFSNEEFRAQLVPGLFRHPILQLEKDEARNREVWDSMPPINGRNTGLIPVEGAQVLAAQDAAKVASTPVLATRRFGEGRSMVIATDMLWNWNFLRVGQGGSGRYYQKFWENVIAWMTRDPQMDPLQVETGKDHYWEDEKVLMHFRSLAPDYNPRANQKARIIVRSIPEGREWVNEEQVLDENGEGRYEFTPPAEGFYTAEVLLDSGEGVSSRRETRFTVFSPTTEFERPQANPGLMKTLADATVGGMHRSLSQSARIENLTFPNPDYEVKINSRTLSLWDSWWSYGLLLFFLTAEWWIRRKSGLS